MAVKPLDFSFGEGAASPLVYFLSALDTEGESLDVYIAQEQAKPRNLRGVRATLVVWFNGSQSLHFG